MKNYDLTILISPDSSDEEVKSFQEKIRDFIQKEEGFLIKENEPTKVRLAYPIKKNNTAILMTINFQLKPERLDSFEKKLKSEKNLLRFLILAKKLSRKISKVPAKPVKKIIKPSQPKVEKVELKEIEKKLDEILGE